MGHGRTLCCAVLLAACRQGGGVGGTEGGSGESGVAPGELRCELDVDHPIDALMVDRFTPEGWLCAGASTVELCRRLYADLLGRFPSADEVAAECEGRDVGEIVEDFQGRAGYRALSRRLWRDRLETHDLESDRRHLQELFALLDRLHAGDLAYGEFVVGAASHPATMRYFETPLDRAYRIFRAFLGHEPTDTEANELARLYVPWTLGSQPGDEGELMPDPDFPFADRRQSWIVPSLCEEFACETALFGGGSIEFPAAAATVPYDEAPADLLDALREPGRLFVERSRLWEAAADEILNRLLAYSDGGQLPREPGIVLPEVRQVVADHLRSIGSYPEAERLVLTSVLYTQTAQFEPVSADHDPDAEEPPVWASGPLKWAATETVLDTAETIVGEIGGCDPRFTELGPFWALYAYQDNDVITTDELDTAFETLYDLLEMDIPKVELPIDVEDPEGPSVTWPDAAYAEMAWPMGGCAGPNHDRIDASAGLHWAFAQEVAAEALCRDADLGQLSGGDGSLAGTLSHQMRALFGREAQADDLADFEAAFANCVGDECAPEGLARGICVALLTDAEMVFY